MRRLVETGPALDDDALRSLRRAPSAADAPGPWVRAVFVSSADGAAALKGVSGGLGSPADARQFALAREDADVVLVAAGTVRAEGYEGPLLSPDARARRAAAGLPDHPPVAVVTGSLGLDPDGEFLRRAPVRPWILTTEAAVAADPERAAALAARADLLTAGRDAVDPDALLTALTRRGVRVVHCEGGPRLFATLAAAGRVDELLLSLAPLLAGGDAPRILAPGTEEDGHGALPADLVLDHVLHEDGMLFLRYRHVRHRGLADGAGTDGHAAPGGRP